MFWLRHKKIVPSYTLLSGACIALKRASLAELFQHFFYNKSCLTLMIPPISFVLKMLSAFLCLLHIYSNALQATFGEHSGSVVECLTRDSPASLCCVLEHETFILKLSTASTQEDPSRHN